MKVFVVVDHVCEADIVIAVFSDKDAAKEFAKENCWPKAKTWRYEALDVEEFELDKVPVTA